MVLEDIVEQREAHISVLESRLGKERPRQPYPLMEREKLGTATHSEGIVLVLRCGHDRPDRGSRGRRIRTLPIGRPSEVVIVR